ncbi:YraN family protein [Alloalcanivorax mobilis]|uniref:YraN family protein n=1 Tax=Alloalcanivorax mobilis TaxID=2019569 RepID=UPI000B5B0F72|nr:YraN family protein [Alloalcanivorax mobilis]ASK34872.1 YraN family protein [Alcanivorax sp. N3-2A]|tara:strand:+ start:22297 stop:22674 length:378 start_codon:yes stop_codon:yes gene_type:complete
MSWSKKDTGDRAERNARAWLERQGLRPVCSNYRCRLGEIDLIMEHQETLVFVEVRWRSRHDYGGAVASVDRRKQRRLTQAARHYLGRHPQQANRPCRFDVLGMEPDHDQEIRYHWIPNAFYASDH